MKKTFLSDGPTNTLASPPMVVDDGTSVSLICNSLANPPIQSYVWFRITDRVQEVGNQSVLHTGENGKYFCRATNEHGSQNSSSVTVKIKGALAIGGLKPSGATAMETVPVHYAMLAMPRLNMFKPARLSMIISTIL